MNGDLKGVRRLAAVEAELREVRKRLLLLADVLPPDTLEFLEMDLDELARRRGFFDPLANWAETSDLTPGEIEQDLANVWARLAPAPKR